MRLILALNRHYRFVVLLLRFVVVVRPTSTSRHDRTRTKTCAARPATIFFILDPSPFRSEVCRLAHSFAVRRPHAFFAPSVTLVAILAIANEFASRVAWKSAPVEKKNQHPKWRKKTAVESRAPSSFVAPPECSPLCRVVFK